MDESLLKEFLNEFEMHYYPDSFLQKYEPLECLANNQMGETLLVKDRFNKFFVAKCYTDQSLLSKATESMLLKKLHYHGLPVFVEEYQNENMLCVVREYASGIPLSQLEQPLSEMQVISIGMQLCDILSYLHGQTPPVIHRDLKPQNIILNESGQVMLIDFGISRVYDKRAKADTVFFGTQKFAPPEQYGFSQTDNRADIFSLGVVLAWLLTGKTDTGQIHIKNKRLAHIVQKCTAFAPKDRYRDAKGVRSALANADGHKQKKMVRISCAGLALLTALTAGFALGRFTDFHPALFYDTSVATFSEPLVEKAVRLQLGKTDTEPIKAEELEQIKELYIYYDQTVKSWEDCNTLRGEVDDGVITVGQDTISTVEDISKLKNLKKLSLGGHNISDISALKNLSELTVLELFKCPVEDIAAVGSMLELEHLALCQCDEVTDLSPIANCTNLSELVLSGCRADDFSVLAQLGDFEYLHVQNVDTDQFLPFIKGKKIKQLHLGFKPLTSISDLAVINGLEELSFDQMQLQSLTGIESLQSLTKISIYGMPGIDLAPLKTLPFLRYVVLSEDMKAAAQAIEEGNNFEINYQ